ncbi:PREDICTED: spermine oxidase-like isoform X1 [Branchiostoma belcheri]|uniref:Spermine oxidase-like isoform X1 n=2 Tax=Branchiostoma belcheri TaxID=7741 RepID=A0A6P4ZL32_BRABE|nr:PREDICTED: spermine oxidase-like isoform X1 [Branchiostoma belcheri]
MKRVTMTTRRPQVVIVGAGIAGLSAAVELTQTGDTDVTVLEAMDRPGGRVHTVTALGVDNLDLGATWLHGNKDNPLYNLALQNNLLGDTEVKVLPAGDKFYTEQGEQVDLDFILDFWSKLDDVTDQAYKGGKADNCESFQSVGEFVDHKFRTELLQLLDTDRVVSWKKLMLAWYKKFATIDNACNSLYNISLSEMSKYEELEGEANVPIPKGYGAVVQVLVNMLPHNCIQYNKPVKLVQWNRESDDQEFPVSVHCEDGSTYFAHHVIVTVSLGYLKLNHSTLFEPPLPQCKVDAISSLGFGTVDKIFLRFPSPPLEEPFSCIQLLWDEDKERQKEVEETWFKQITGFHTLEGHPEVLYAWIGGKAAEFMESLSNTEVGKVCTQILRQFTGRSDIPDAVEVLCSRWHSNPYICGAYTNVPVNCKAKASDVLAEPLPGHANCHGKGNPLQVLFAGEATITPYITTTHGAFISGKREATRLTDLYK